jgi:hypothetical protein
MMLKELIFCNLQTSDLMEISLTTTLVMSTVQRQFTRRQAVFNKKFQEYFLG